MPEDLEEITGKCEKDISYYLEDAIYEYVKNNPRVDSVDIVNHFQLRSDITLLPLQKLVNQGKIDRKWFGFRYGYVVKE